MTERDCLITVEISSARWPDSRPVMQSVSGPSGSCLSLQLSVTRTISIRSLENYIYNTLTLSFLEFTWKSFIDWILARLQCSYCNIVEFQPFSFDKFQFVCMTEARREGVSGHRTSRSMILLPQLTVLSPGHQSFQEADKLWNFPRHPLLLSPGETVLSIVLVLLDNSFSGFNELQWK